MDFHLLYYFIQQYLFLYWFYCMFQATFNKAAHTACGWTRTSYACARLWRRRYALRLPPMKIRLGIFLLMLTKSALAYECIVKDNVIQDSSAECSRKIFEEEFLTVSKYAVHKDLEFLMEKKKILEERISQSCLDDKCIKSEYAKASNELSTITSTSHGRVKSEAAASEILHDLSNELVKLGININNISCHSYVNISQSHGAICHLPNGQDILLCNNYMVGKFTLKSSGFTINVAQVSDFIVTNCPRGG